MLKINISFSKKVPGEQEFSSINFHGSMEKELSDGLSPEQIQQAYQSSYQLLEQTVEQEIQNYTGRQTGVQQAAAAPANQFTQQQNQGYSNTLPTTAKKSGSQASQKQITFLNRLGAERNMNQAQIDALAQNNFAVASIWQLSKKQASDLINQLQNQRAA